MAFASQTVLTNSASKIDTVSGSNLTGFPDSITIKSPSTDFQVSKDDINWRDSVRIAYTTATLSATRFYVRFTPQTAGSKTGNVKISGGGVTPSLSVSVSGTGLDPVGPVPYAVTGSTYTETFNGLPNTGSYTLGSPGPFYLSGSPVFGGGVVGWQFGATLGDPAKFAVDAGGSGTGSTYSYGSSGSTDRALGAVASGSGVSDLGVVITNTTSNILTTVTISYTGEQWRRGSGSANSLFFSYKVNASAISATGTTPVSALNFTAPTVSGTDTALNGNSPANRTAIGPQTFTLDSNWLPGQNLVLRWDDVNDGGNDDGIGIDDFNFSAIGPLTPTRQDSIITFTNISTFSLTANWLTGNGTRRIVVVNTSNSFTNPVNLTSPAANFVYSGSGEQVVYNGPGNSVNVAGLLPGTTYYFRVFNYNGFGASSTYNTNTAPGNPNSQITVAPGPPTKLVITSVNGGNTPAQNIPFYIVVRSFDASNYPQNVSVNTVTGIRRFAGTGTLSGTLSGTILANQNTDTIFGIVYNFPETGVVLRDTVTSGNALADAYSDPFEVTGVASQLTFSGVPASGIVNTRIGSFSVYALKDDFTTDPNYTDSITLSVVAGPGVMSGRFKKPAIGGIAVFDSIQFSLAGTYTLQADAPGLFSATSTDIIITNAPTMAELVIPKYIGSKTGTSSNNSRTPIAICVRIDNLLPNTSYDVKAGLDTTTAPATSYGAGNVWSPSSFTVPTQIDTTAFITDGSGSSGAYWIYIQPATTRFDAGQVHNLRLGFVTTGGTFPANPNFVGAKTITALDIATAPRTADTTDDGAFMKGSTASCIQGKFILIFNNVSGTGDPLFSYQARQAVPTNTPQSELPTAVNDVYTQTGTSALGDWPAVIPIGANNPNGVRRVEARNADNTLFSFATDADGVWPGGANTTTIKRRIVATLTLADAGMNSVSISSISSTQASCVGTNDGTATVVATGTGALSYSWNSTPVQTTSSATGLAAGTYTVTVSDSKGCTATASVTVTQPATSTITPSGPINICQGDSVLLTAGAGANHYSWSTNPSVDTLQTVYVKTAGNITVTVTAGTCTQTSLPVTVNVNSFGVNGTIFSESMGTPGSTTVVNSYTGWQNVAPITFRSTSASQSDVRTTSSSSGYAGASGGGNVFFTTVSARNFIISGINTLNYSTLRLTFGLRRDAGTTADPMIVEVSTNDTVYTPLTIVQPSAINTWILDTAVGSIPATANLRIRFTKNGISASSYRLDDVKLIGSTTTIKIAVTGDTTVCASTGGVRLTSNVATGNTWSPTNATTNSIVATTSGTYTVTSSGTTGCPATSAPVTITINPNPTVAITSVTNASCFGTTDGSITASASGGTGTLSYAWNSSPAQFTPTASNLGAGTYTVTVNDIKGCTAKDSGTVTQPTQITVTAAVADSVVCQGATTSLSSTGTTTSNLTFTNSTPVFIPDSTVANGIVPVTSPISVSGLNMTSLSNGIANVKIISLTHPFVGDLILRLIGPDGRSLILSNRRGGSGDNYTNTIFSSSSASLITSATAPFSSTFKPDTSSTAAAAFGIFNGLNPNGTWQLFVSDNAPADSGFLNSWSITFNNPLNFSWTSTPAGFTSSVKSPGTVTPSSLGLGTVTYHVVATNPITGCTASSNVSVLVNSTPSANADSTGVSCHGLSNGTAFVNVTGGTPPFTYSWNSSPVQTTQTATGLAPGNYTVTVTDTNHCSVSSTTTVTQPDTLTVSTSSTNATCNGGTDGSVAAVASGGTTPYSYLWTNTGSVNPAQATQNNLGAGTYNVTVTDNHGCTATGTATVSEPPAIVVSSFSPASGCTGDTVKIIGSNFAGVTDVKFNGVSASSFIIIVDSIRAVVPSGATSGLITVVKGTCSGSSSTAFIISCGVIVNVRALIQGYYVGGGQMTPVLFNELISTSDAEVDTVTIEARDAADFSLIDRYTAVIDTGGKVTGTMTVATAGTPYYIGVRHHSALFTCSANPVMFSAVTNYNFTLDPNSAYGTAFPSGDPYLQEYNELDGHYAIYSGDVNQDEYIDTGDVTPVDNDNLSGAFSPGGYWISDINGDGYVDTGDVTPTDNNNLSGLYSQHP